MVLKASTRTQYPIPYRVWRFAQRKRPRIDSPAKFLASAEVLELLAEPVPGTDAGPWLKGTKLEHELWTDLFDGSLVSNYQARKGITTDLNGVYFVRLGKLKDDSICIENDPSIGRTSGLPVVRQLIELDHVFPLIRGKGLQRFVAQTDPDFHIIVPQRGMNGDPTLPESAPKTYSFFNKFKNALKARGSYRRYQTRHPFWSTWSTGPYTFSKYKVLWKEMSGSRFCAGYVSSEDIAGAGRKIIVPDHKLYFVPVDSLKEAQFLTGILNARTISRAISAYAAQLSLGVSVIEYLKIPKFDPKDPLHENICELSKTATQAEGHLSEAEELDLDKLAIQILVEHKGSLNKVSRS